MGFPNLNNLVPYHYKMCQLYLGALIEKITLTMQHRSIFLTSFIVVFVSMRTSAKYAVVIDGKSQAEAYIPKHKECVTKVGLYEEMCLPPNRPSNCSEESWKQLHFLKPPVLPCPSTFSKAQIEICPKLKDFNGTLDVSKIFLFIKKSPLCPDLDQHRQSSVK